MWYNIHMKDNIKRWLVSSVITFSAGAGVVLIANWDQITLEAFKDGSIVGLVFLAVRAGIKGIIEGFLAWYGIQK